MNFIQGKLYRLILLGYGEKAVVMFLSYKEYYNGLEIRVLEGNKIKTYDYDDCCLVDYV